MLSWPAGVVTQRATAITRDVGLVCADSEQGVKVSVGWGPTKRKYLQKSELQQISGRVTPMSTGYEICKER